MRKLYEYWQMGFTLASQYQQLLAWEDARQARIARERAEIHAAEQARAMLEAKARCSYPMSPSRPSSKKHSKVLPRGVLNRSQRFSDSSKAFPNGRVKNPESARDLPTKTSSRPCCAITSMPA